MAAIQILLAEDANRRALASLLEERHEPITETTVGQADLYLVDDGSLPRYRDALATHKRDRDPVFCPVVLIRRPQTAHSIDLPAPDPTEGPVLVDEVVTAPVEKRELFRRLANLLVRRRQTTELEEKNRRLEQFARTLRHEVRNPLHVLDGYLDIAREQGDPESFDRCQTAIDRMQRLFEETLFVLQGADIELDTDRLPLGEIAADCWDVVPESDATLEVATERQIAADGDRLKQLLENLFRNAIEHAGDDVTVTVGELDHGDGFYVADDGPGIPESEREVVFEDGYTTSGAGTGIGLAVVDRVAEAHGWEVRITDSAEGGARFEFAEVDRAVE